ncbi:hypothetical protein TNCV_435971 [Trichonephila clavipes]|nr:hypothetical protein TNCV_435971 [Trichonephila clavipes]
MEFNSTEFLAQFSEHSSHDARVEFSKDSNESSKVLGLFWNSSNDTFGFQPSLELTPPLTKRRILSESSKIFDPLDFFFTLYSIHEDFLSKTLAYKNRLGFSHSTTINRGLA